MSEKMPNGVMVLAEFERTGAAWSREGARTAVRPDGKVRIILQVLGCRIEWRGTDGSWHTMSASYPLRERLGVLLEAWLSAKLPDHAG